MPQINDTLFKALGDLGFSGALPDRMYKHLASLGHSGSITDKLYKEGGFKIYTKGLISGEPPSGGEGINTFKTVNIWS